MQEAVSRRTLVRVVLEQVDALGGELANVGCRRVGVTNRRVRPAQIVYGVQALFGSVSLGMDEKNTKGRYRLADWRRVREQTVQSSVQGCGRAPMSTVMIVDGFTAAAPAAPTAETGLLATNIRPSTTDPPTIAWN